MLSDLQCPGSQKPCLDGSKCVEGFQWCDGTVQCPDASDEISCSCKTRVDRSRLCDGYFDCPNGDDELECFSKYVKDLKPLEIIFRIQFSDCPRLTFSCDDWTEQGTDITCVPIDKRCDGISDCRNGKDELDCSILLDNLSHTQVNKVSGQKVQI